MSRVLTKRGFNLSANQIDTEYYADKIDIVTVPSVSAPSFGGTFLLEYKENNTEVLDMVIQFNYSALTGTTSTNFVPAFFHPLRIEWIQSGQVQDTYLATEQFLRNNIYVEDEDRNYVNIGAGAYQSSTQRIALAGANSSYYLPLRGLFKQGHSVPVLNNNHWITLRIVMDSLVNITAPAGAPVCTFTGCNLMAKVIRLRAEEAQERLHLIRKRPMHIKFSESRNIQTVVRSGVSTASILLNTLVGRISHLMFVVRPTASISNAGAFSFNQIASFAIFDGNTNITSGQDITNSQALHVLNKDWVLSTYTSENSLGYGTNNNANVYMWSWALDPIGCILEGKSSGFYKFSGNELLRINFGSTLGADVQVDVFAYNEAVLEIHENKVVRKDFAL